MSIWADVRSVMRSARDSGSSLRRRQAPRGPVALLERLEARTLLSAASGYTFTTLDPPGSPHTEAMGISGGTVVGYYYDGPVTHGFIYNGSTYTTLDIPGARSTFATGVSGRTVVGYFYTSDVSDAYGFIYDGSTFTTLDVPGADHGAADLGTRPSAISDNTVVGWYSAGGEDHGFIYDGSTYRDVSFYYANQVHIFGFSEGAIVGNYRDNNVLGRYHGFIQLLSTGEQENLI